MKDLFNPSAKRIQAPFFPSIYAYVDKTPGGRFRFVSVNPHHVKPKRSEGRTCGTWSEPGSAEHKAAFQNVQERLRKLSQAHAGVVATGQETSEQLSDIGFLEFLRQRVELDTARNRRRCRWAYNYASRVFPETLKLRDLKHRHYVQLKEQLLLSLSAETARNYLAWIKGQLSRAAKEFELIDRNPWAGRSIAVGNYHTAEHKKQRLNRHELNKLKAVRCTLKEAVTLKAFLFACATGCGRAELLVLNQGNIKRNADGTGKLTLIRRKTEQHAPMRCTIPLSANTLQLIPHSGRSSELLFPNLPSDTAMNGHLKALQERAALDRPDISFYCGRHSFICFHIEAGTPLHLLMKMTGHAELKALMRYAQSLQLEQDGLGLDLAI